MAKHILPPPNDRMRARFVLCEVEGSSQEIQNAAQAFAQVMKSSQPTVVYLPPPQESVRALPPAAQPNGHAAAPPNEAVPEPVPAPAEATAPQSRPQNGGKKKFRTPVLVPNLETTSGPKSLQAYIEEQAPKDHSKRYLAIAYWLRQYRNASEINTDHVFTCYRALKLNVPHDVGSVLRKLKVQAWMETGSARGMFKLTHIGENQLIPEKKQ